MSSSSSSSSVSSSSSSTSSSSSSAGMPDKRLIVVRLEDRFVEIKSKLIEDV